MPISPFNLFGTTRPPAVVHLPTNPDDPYGFAFGPPRPENGYRPVPARQNPSAEIYGVTTTPQQEAYDTLLKVISGVKLGVGNGMQIGLRASAPAVKKTAAKQRKPQAADPAAPPPFTQDPSAAAGANGLTADQLKSLTDAFSARPDYASLAKEAAALASGDVGAQVGAYRTQQDQLINEGKATAATILAAAKAAAGLNPGLAGILKNNYGNAAEQLAGITKSLTGQVLQPGQNTPTMSGVNPATAPGLGAAALNELHGVIPAYGLEQAGLSAFDEAKQLGHLIHGGGTQEALLAQGAKNQEANALLANISNVEGQLPHLTNQYLSQLSSQDLDRLKYNAANALAFAKLGISSKAASSKGGLIDASTTTATGLQTNKDGTVRTDQRGLPLPKVGDKLVYKPGVGYVGEKIVKPTASKSLSATGISSLGDKVASWGRGGVTVRTVNGQPVPYPDPNHPKVPLQIAITRVMTRTHWSAKQALDFIVSNSQAYLNEYQASLPIPSARVGPTGPLGIQAVG